GDRFGNGGGNGFGTGFGRSRGRPRFGVRAGGPGCHRRPLVRCRSRGRWLEQGELRAGDLAPGLHGRLLEGRRLGQSNLRNPDSLAPRFAAPFPGTRTLFKGRPWTGEVHRQARSWNNGARGRRASARLEMDELERWRPEFPILEKTVYLISNSLGAMPRGAARG